MYLRYFEYYFSMRRTWSLNWIIYYFLQMYLRADKDVTKNVFMIVMTLSIAVQSNKKKLLINDVQTDT
ncbi:hypothetical protein AM334_10545 [Klebsiella aerogenes]|nr:hypothetical protein AM334_10545 [Klebsiella aerogenes]